MLYSSDLDLAAVTCPPYDAVTASDLASYEERDAYNAVRLIQPRGDSRDDRYTHAAQTLRTWRSLGVLQTLDDPALYVYSQVTESGTAVGLIGGLALDGPILPHENTFPGPIADRVALMNAAQAQFEPILVTYDGGGAASDIVGATTTRQSIVDFALGDGSQHRLWRVDDAAAIAEIRSDLATREALIADGHHRFAAYRELQCSTSAASDDFGLAMLVDAKRHPLQLRAMHRSVRGLDFADAITLAAKGMRVEPLSVAGDPLRGLLDKSAKNGAAACFVVTDGQNSARLTAPSADLLALALPDGRPPLWRSLDSAVLKHALLDHLWGVDDADKRVGYHHRIDDALAVAESQDDTVAVLVRPPSLPDVMSLAKAGERMPQKSTSFGPKPRTGLLMRPLN